jgi:hypothetical protein
LCALKAGLVCDFRGDDSRYRDCGEAQLKETAGSLFQLHFGSQTSFAISDNRKGLGFATQDRSWCAFIGDA